MIFGNPMKLIGGIVVVWVAMSRFNQPPPVLEAGQPDGSGIISYLRKISRWKTQIQEPLFRPLRANTTAFSYRISQLAYALLAFAVYLLLLEDGVLSQIEQIIDLVGNLFGIQQDALNFPEKAGALVVAAIVVVILPLFPPFRWADISIRQSLYTRARIPAQLRREMSRLKQARFQPPREIMDVVCKHAQADGFSAQDISCDPDHPTARALWCKCVILMEEIGRWEANDRYKTAFAVIYEPEGSQPSVEIVHSGYKDLVTDAKTYFNIMHNPSAEDREALRNRETRFRGQCKELLERIYGLLSRVSLHAHYSEHERVEKLGKLGFLLTEDKSGPIPDPNDLIILGLILVLLLVGPLSHFANMPMGKAIMIGCIMFTAVLTPIVLASICPGIGTRKSVPSTPNILYPVASGAAAMFMGMLIILVGSLFIDPRPECGDNGWMWYTTCAYPWGFLHGGIALLLAWRMRSGRYPEIQQLEGLNRIRKWGDPIDALICASGMVLIALFLVVPLLESLPTPKVFEGWRLVRMLLTVGILSFTLGFIVPTWYRANQQR